jgi:hypothetical protein
MKEEQHYLYILSLWVNVCIIRPFTIIFLSMVLPDMMMKRNEMYLMILIFMLLWI